MFRYAVKVIKKKQMEAEGSTKEEDVRREIRIATSLTHPNIVVTTKGYETPEHFYIFMEPVVGGDLFDLVRKASYSNPSSWMNESLCRRLFGQLLEAFKARRMQRCRQARGNPPYDTACARASAASAVASTCTLWVSCTVT